MIPFNKPALVGPEFDYIREALEAGHLADGLDDGVALAGDLARLQPPQGDHADDHHPGGHRREDAKHGQHPGAPAHDVNYDPPPALTPVAMPGTQVTVASWWSMRGAATAGRSGFE